MLNQEELHLKVISKSHHDRIEAAEEICSEFLNLINQDQAISDVRILASDQHSEVRMAATKAIGQILLDAGTMSPLLRDLFMLARDEVDYVRDSAFEILELITGTDYLENNWPDIENDQEDPCMHPDLGEEQHTSEFYTFLSELIVSKDLDMLNLLLKDEDSDLRRAAAECLCSSLIYLGDKDRACYIIQRLVQDSDSEVRRLASVTVPNQHINTP